MTCLQRIEFQLTRETISRFKSAGYRLGVSAAVYDATERVSNDVAIFRSRLRTEFLDEYRPLAEKMLEIARSMTGFKSFKSFAAKDGERVSIIEFDTLANLEAWRDQPQHQRAQALGRERYYAEYCLQIGTPVRAYSFKDDHRTDHVGPKV